MRHGTGEPDVPYFSLDRATPITPDQWKLMRAKWNHTHGITNVWQEPALRRLDRLAERRHEPLTAQQLAAVREKLGEIADLVRTD